MSITLPSPKDRNLIFNKDVTQETIGEISRQILEINADDVYLTNIYFAHNLVYVPKPILMYIDSHGGRVYQCLGLLSIMETSKTPIHTIVTGIAASAGFLISITGHERFGYDKATFMYHQSSGSFSGTLKGSIERLEESKRLMDIIEKHVLKQTRIPIKKLKSVYESKLDWYINSTEALKIGIIDKIL